MNNLDVITDLVSGTEDPVLAYLQGSALEALANFSKGGVTDLRRAQECIKRMLDHMVNPPGINVGIEITEEMRSNLLAQRGKMASD